MEDASLDSRLDKAEVFLRVHRNTYYPAHAKLDTNANRTNPYDVDGKAGPLSQVCTYLRFAQRGGNRVHIDQATT